MSRRKLIDAMVHAGHGHITEAAAARAYDAFVNTITSEIVRGGKGINVPGLGKFTPVGESAVSYVVDPKLMRQRQEAA